MVDFTCKMRNKKVHIFYYFVLLEKLKTAHKFNFNMKLSFSSTKVVIIRSVTTKQKLKLSVIRLDDGKKRRLSVQTQ